MSFENLIFIGFVMLILGIILITVGSLLGAQKDNTKTGIGGFIFFIPFGWANDPQLLKLILIVSAVALIAFMVLLLR